MYVTMRPVVGAATDATTVKEARSTIAADFHGSCRRAMTWIGFVCAAERRRRELKKVNDSLSAGKNWFPSARGVSTNLKTDLRSYHGPGWLRRGIEGGQRREVPRFVLLTAETAVNRRGPVRAN
jgi:hypothetical protein